MAPSGHLAVNAKTIHPENNVAPQTNKQTNKVTVVCKRGRPGINHSEFWNWFTFFRSDQIQPLVFHHTIPPEEFHSFLFYIEGGKTKKQPQPGHFVIPP